MFDNQPLVSIVIPVYNGADYMREAIDSALAQTYPNCEVIVINDGSVDAGKTKEIALSYGSRIRYIEKPNGGVSSALNCGIKAMKGEYFSWLSHDDMYEPSKIENQIRSLRECRNNRTVSMCLTDTVDANSRVIQPEKPFGKSESITSEEAVIYMTKKGANGCSLLIPKTAFDEVGLFEEQLRYCQDILMWWRIFFSGYELVFCNELGVHYRVHGRQLTQRGRSLYHEEARIVGKLMIPLFCSASSKKSNFLFEYAKWESIRGNFLTVEESISEGKNAGLLSGLQRIELRLLKIYGRIRPLIRRLYYLIIRRIKTE